MNTNTVHYKGFDIGYSEDGRFRIIPSMPGFNPSGYATQNNAKGAITKHLNARADVLEAVIAHKAVKVTSSRNKREGKYAGKSHTIVIAGNRIKPYHYRSANGMNASKAGA